MKSKHPTSNIQHPTSNEGSERRFDLEERMLAYAGRIVELVDELPNTRSANHIGGQLLRSGTSPYLHHGEVQAAESVNDFIHKLKVCLKELRESWRALRLLHRCCAVKEKSEIESLIDETHQLIRIFYQSVRTTESRGEQSPRMREVGPVEHSMLDVECWMLDVSEPTEVERGPVVYPKPAKKRRPK